MKLTISMRIDHSLKQPYIIIGTGELKKIDKKNSKRQIKVLIKKSNMLILYENG
jgi:hypothetical protein